jgi:ketosteroid isomerase-like protein
VPNAVASADRVALEVEWEGVLAIPVAGLEAGATMRAWFAMFLEFRDGKIVRQNNYDCFEPWWHRIRHVKMTMVIRIWS